jgi:hypothetical protein
MNPIFTTIAVVGWLYAGVSAAATFSFTGSEMIGRPWVSFPSQSPTVLGSSLIFGPGSTDFGKLVSIDLSTAFGAPISGPRQISAVFNVTRLPCDEAPGRCAGGITDWDPFIAIGDGKNLFGAQLNDPGQVFAEEHQDFGIAGHRGRHDLVKQSIQYPAIGESMEVRLDFVLQQNASLLTVDVHGDNVAYTASEKITAHVPLNLVLLRDNDIGERYQLNSISISTPLAVPEPSTFALVGLTALALGWAARRRH